MPPLVMSQVCRFAVYGDIGDQQWNNIWDIRIAEARPAADAKIVTVAERLMDQYSTVIRPLLADDWTIVGCRWVDLDSLGGGTGQITDTPTGTFPQAGSVGGQCMPGNVAALVVKNTTGGRSSRNGRSFVCGVPSNILEATNPNKMTAANVASWQTAWNTFLTAIDAPVGGVDCEPGVVSRPLSSAIAFRGVSALTVQARLATCRSRLRD